MWTKLTCFNKVQYESVKRINARLIITLSNYWINKGQKIAKLIINVHNKIYESILYIVFNF